MSTPYVDFSIFAVTTVLSSYYADMINPIHYPFFPPRTEPVYGYAPYLKVEFRNNSVPAPGYDTQEFIWHFGDYYSDVLSFTLTSTNTVEHIYRMPGKYTVSLTLKQTSSSIAKPINVTTSRQVIEVKENFPTARMHVVSRPVYGDDPLTLIFTPEFCVPGSFPLERIDWNFGDGSPIKTLTKYTTPTSDPEIIYNNIFNRDTSDVRNYYVQHTYHRPSFEREIFYPSLTCYSSNTYSFDTCSVTIGPVFGKNVYEPFSILKSRNSVDGNLHKIKIPSN